MTSLRIVVPALLALLALAAPLGGAHHGGYHWTGTLYGAYATPVISSADNHLFQLDAGETVQITLEWFDPLADLDVFVIGPSGGCTVLPEPDVSCNVNSAMNVLNRVTCPAGTAGRTLLGASPETLTFTASVSGAHTLVVAASAGDVLVNGVPYFLSVDGGSNFQAPTFTNWLRLDACRQV